APRAAHRNRRPAGARVRLDAGGLRHARPRGTGVGCPRGGSCRRMTASARPPLRAWLDLARAGNLPSVWSNVLAALVLATPAAAAGTASHLWPPLPLWLGATFVGSLAYAG